MDDLDALFQHMETQPGESLEERNSYFRTLHLLSDHSTDGVPDKLYSTVQMLRTGFPSGIVIDSPDYNAIWAFFDRETWPDRAVASVLDFAFNLGYVTVLNAKGWIEDEALREREVLRIEQILSPLGLDHWRAEVERTR